MGALRDKIRTQSGRCKLPSQKWAVIFILSMQVIFIILMGVFARYDNTAHAWYGEYTDSDTKVNPLIQYYPKFQDVNVMIFVGFPFLVSFLKRHGLSSNGVNMLTAVFSIQWATILHGIIEMIAHQTPYFYIHIKTMLFSEFACATVLVSWCVVLGRTNIFQLAVMAFIEIIVHRINEYVCIEYFHVIDVGGSIFVHVFGAYFGLAASRILYGEDIAKVKKEEAVYHSEMFAFIGTAFLWVFWPSFNSAMATGDFRHRAVLNTFYAMCACSVAVYVTSILCDKEGKATPAYAENATLAGGVAVGACADLMIEPFGAMILGVLGGVISTIGFKYVQPYILQRWKIHDTCGVHNLHGMPGILAAIGSAIAAAAASEAQYGASLYKAYGALAPPVNTTSLELLRIHLNDFDIQPGVGRAPHIQGGYQMLAMIVTLLVAVISGMFTGLLLKLKFFDPPKGDNMFEDGVLWNMYHDGIPAFDPMATDENSKS